VITNHDDLELAMFMSKTLVSSIISFTKRSKAASEDRALVPSQPPEVPVGRDERYSGREEYLNAPKPVQVIELDCEQESSPNPVAMSKNYIRRQQKKAHYSSYAYGQPVDADERNKGGQPQATRFDEFSPTVASLMRNSPPRRGRKDNRLDRDDEHYSTLPRAARIEASSGSHRGKDSYDRPGPSDQGLRTDPEFYNRGAEVGLRYPEMVTRDDLREAILPRRTSMTERASGEVDLRSRLMPKNYEPVIDTAAPDYRGLDPIDSRSYAGTKRVGSDYSHEPAKQPRSENQYPY